MRAIVTGGANGIGAEVARRLIRDGASVAIVDTDGAALERILDEEGSAGVVACNVDVSDPNSATVVGGLCGRWSGIDLLVYAAGVSESTDVRDISTAMWRRVIDVNLSGFFYWSQAVARPMIAAGFGRIVGITSVNALAAEPNCAHYVASKGGMSALIRALAVDLGRFGLTINGVAPGAILTERVSNTLGSSRVDKVRMTVPTGDLGQSTDVASAVLWLASRDARYVNGHVVVVDGGMTAQL
jgi:NAD(P)-dependent dehydrogenase (short-subunit alcohol dehydrogenase family)